MAAHYFYYGTNLLFIGKDVACMVYNLYIIIIYAYSRVLCANNRSSYGNKNIVQNLTNPLVDIVDIHEKIDWSKKKRKYLNMRIPEET